MPDVQDLLQLGRTRDVRSVPIELIERYLELAGAVRPLEEVQDLNNMLILDRLDKTTTPVGKRGKAQAVGRALVAAMDGEGVAKGHAARQVFAGLSDAIHIRVADYLELTAAVMKRDKKATNNVAMRSNKLILLFAAVDPAKAHAAIGSMSIQDARTLLRTVRKISGKSTFLTRFEGIQSVRRSFVAIVVELKALLANRLEDRAFVRKTCRDLFRGRQKLEDLMGNLMEARYGLVTPNQQGGGTFSKLSHQIIGLVSVLYLLVFIPLAPLVLAPIVTCYLMSEPYGDFISDDERTKAKNFECLPRMFAWPMFAIAAGYVELAVQVPKEFMFSKFVTPQEREQRYQNIMRHRYEILFHFYNFGHRFPDRNAYESALRRFMIGRGCGDNAEMPSSDSFPPAHPDSDSQTPTAELTQLGFKPGDEITHASLAQAYRRNALKLHPDRVLDPGMSEKQTARFVDMKAAVDRVDRWLRLKRAARPS
jgi:hypothetical protein